MPRVKGVSAAGDDNLKKRWNFSLTQIARDGIGRLFKFWGYSDASALLEALADVPRHSFGHGRYSDASALLEALGRGEIFLSREPLTFASLLVAKDLIAVDELSDIPVRRLKEFLDGALPTVNELMDLENALGISQENLMQICGYPEKNFDNQDEPPENS
ncbi:MULTISPECIES: hypothetical protein [Cyanophyceae]|uniref:hypothetical protein n=1 Tax=Cyanophyceae TaxID=3028117 RepID=UPI0016889C7A|nr:hypothetical protein [Trichocoleus sp. FACHB-69]MBD1931234.1 hypothetical protein [Trichocoleus sp. FACHB-69]